MTDFTDQAARFTQAWADFASKMTAAGMTLRPDQPPTEASRQVRDAMLQAMSGYCDQFMRSPEFLDMMRQSMDASMTLRQQFNQFLTKSYHAGQGVAQQDIGALLQAVHHMENRALDCMDQMNKRLDEICARLEAIERAADSAEPEKRPQKKVK